MNADFAARFGIRIRELHHDTFGITALAILDDGSRLGARSGLLANIAVLVGVVEFNLSILRGRDVDSVNGHSLLLGATREAWAAVDIFAGSTRGTFSALKRLV